MKKLTRVKLINWHRFVNATIDLEKSTLISGENGAGKSTFLKILSGEVEPNTGEVIIAPNTRMSVISQDRNK